MFYSVNGFNRIQSSFQEPGRVDEWLACRIHDLLITGSSLTGTSNILGQDMNLVGTSQCLPSRGQQHVAPKVDLREHTLHSPPQKANKAEPTLALKPGGDIIRNIYILCRGDSWFKP